MESQPVSIWKSSFKYGVVLGLVSILISLFIWAGRFVESLGLVASGLLGLLTLIINFILLLIFSKSYRDKELGGFITFSEAFQFGLLVVLFATLLITVYNFIFHTVIDPEYTKNLMAIMQQKTLNFMENAGIPEAQIDEALRNLEDVPTLWETLRQGFLSGLISGVVLSLITAAIVKKNKELRTEA